MSLGPTDQSAGIVLLKPRQWIVTNSNVEATTGNAPQDIKKIRFFGNAGHSQKRVGCGGWI